MKGHLGKRLIDKVQSSGTRISRLETVKGRRVKVTVRKSICRSRTVGEMIACRAQDAIRNNREWWYFYEEEGFFWPETLED